MANETKNSEEKKFFPTTSTPTAFEDWLRRKYPQHKETGTGSLWHYVEWRDVEEYVSSVSQQRDRYREALEEVARNSDEERIREIARNALKG
jgi:hypothetical protein